MQGQSFCLLVLKPILNLLDQLIYKPSDGDVRSFLKDLDSITTISYNPKSKTTATLALQDGELADLL